MDKMNKVKGVAPPNGILGTLPFEGKMNFAKYNPS